MIIFATVSVIVHQLPHLIKPLAAIDVPQGAVDLEPAVVDVVARTVDEPPLDAVVVEGAMAA